MKPPAKTARKSPRQAELLPRTPSTLAGKIKGRVHEKVGTIALTLRIDADRYKQFTQKAARDGVTKQDVLSALLDDYLAS